MRCKCLIMAIVVAVMSLSGCKKGHDLTGTWEAKAAKGVTMTFNSDGSFSTNADVMGMKVSQKGTYKLQNTDLTLTISDVSMSASDPKMQSLIDMQKQAIQQEKGKSHTLPITWNNDNEFQMQAPTNGPGGGNAAVFDRKS